MSRTDIRQFLRGPIVSAPMAGGPSGPELVAAVCGAGGLGFLAAGYKTAAALRAELDALRALTDAPFGVNVFVPGSPTDDPESLDRYLASLAADADALRASLAEAAWDDDQWAAKVEMLLADPPPVVSFTFGCPERDLVEAFHTAGSMVVVTVAAPEEAATAASAAPDLLCVQGTEAGAHRGTFTNDQRSNNHRLMSLIDEVARVTDLPQIAAGGIMDAQAVTAVLAAGAVAAQCGTAFLRCPESGAPPLHKAALADPSYTTTAVTRAFSGRPARGLVNRFMLEHEDAPPAYPEINNATRPLRAAAASAGDADRVNLWAGAGFRAATARPAAEVVELLTP